MKRFLSLAATMLALVFASSCAQEELAQNASDEAVGTLSVSIPDVMTKAYGDGMYDAKNLIIGVFDENGVEKFRKNLVWGKDVFTQEIKIQFVMGKKYQMVFWAQYGNAYGDPKSMPLDEIKLDYKVSNREDLDAFYAYVPEFTVTQDFSKNITLKRPFAQLNFATEVGDMDESIAAGDLGIHNKAAVTIKNVANTLDLFTGKTFYVDGDGAVKATGVEVVVPETEFPKVDGKYPTIVVEEKTYEVISMNYVLVADDASVDGKTTVDLKLKVGELEIEVPNAYMKRNWRTNVVGELLTGEGTFKVTIDPIFDGAYDHNWNDGTSGEDVVNTFAAAASEKNPAKVDAKGGKYYVDVTSNVAWTVTVPQGLKAEPATGDKDAEVVVTVPENTTEKDVTYEVVVKTTAEVATKEYKFTVAQAAAAPVVPDEPDPIVPAVALTLVSTEAVPAEGGNVVVKVTSNVAWTLALDGTKVADDAEAVTDFEVTVPVAANTATEVANHTLLLSDVPAEGAQAVTATAQFTQAAAQPEEPETPETITVAEFLAAEVDENVYYRLKGTITSVANTTYGNFDLTDETGTVYIYGLVSEDGATSKYWATSGAKLGDDIVISVPRAEFNNAPQGKNARFIELISPGTYAFYTLGTEAVDFTSAGGEQVVAVDVYNTSAAVTASSDNAKFAVSVNGKNVTISSTANELEEKVQGNVTVQVGNLAAKTIKVTLAAKPASGVVEGGQDDFHTISSTNTSYVSGKTTAGWEYKNCAILKGGSSDSNPAFNMIGEESNRALCMNGKTSAVGTITSPTLTTGCGTLKFNYALPFSDTKIKFRVDIIQNGETVHTFTVDKASAEKLVMYSHEEVVNVAGDFQIVFTNLSPSNSTSNKDRTAIWDVEWTGCAK